MIEHVCHTELYREPLGSVHLDISAQEYVKCSALLSLETNAIPRSRCISAEPDENATRNKKDGEGKQEKESAIEKIKKSKFQGTKGWVSWAHTLHA